MISIVPRLYRWFDWDYQNKSSEIHKLSLKMSDKVLTQLEDVGQQLALAFNNDGTTLAAGGEVWISFIFTLVKRNNIRLMLIFSNMKERWFLENISTN